MLPIHLNFSPERQSASPTLNARGFLLGLTDAHAVQLDERRFRVYTPAGRYRTFHRDRKNPNVIHSGKNWKGELKGDVLSVSSECGDRLTYHQGVISQMQLKNRKFDFIKSGRTVTEIREGGKSILRVSTDPLTGNLKFGFGFDREIKFEFAERPIVQVVAEKNVVGKTERSLHKVSGGNGFSQNFDFAVNEKIQPTIHVGSQGFTWDAATGFLLSDGVWQYDTKLGETELDNAIIERANFKGEKESWRHNKAKGEEIVQGSNGVKKITTWFTAGKLAGKMRKIETQKPSDKNISSLITYTYDADSRLIRRTEDSAIFTFEYGLNGKTMVKKKLGSKIIYANIQSPTDGLLWSKAGEISQTEIESEINKHFSNQSVFPSQNLTNKKQ